MPPSHDDGSGRQPSSVASGAPNRRIYCCIVSAFEIYTRPFTGGGDPPAVESLVSKAMVIFSKTDQALPCSRLALTAHDFTALVTGRGSIASFLRASPPPASRIGAQTETSDVAMKYPSKGEDGGLSSDIDRKLLRGGGCEPHRHVGQVEAGSHGGDSSSSRTSSSGCTDPVDHESGAIPVLAECLQKKCPKCGLAVAAESLPEHLDFHYAKGLQESYTREENVAQGMAARKIDGGVAKRRKPEGEKGGEKRHRETKRSGPPGQNCITARIDSFFKPA